MNHRAFAESLMCVRELPTGSDIMIHLHRIKGEELVLNADLIELIEATPDTVITLIDGRKIVVQESPDAVVDAVRRFRAGVLASAEAIRSQPAELLAFPGGKTDD